jgi:hypothetical protein
MIILADLGWIGRAFRGILFSVILVLLQLASLAQASTVTLAWDASSDPMVTGYNIYSGTVSHSYTNLVNAGMATSVTISNLVPGTTYYFAATTYTLSGLESDYSLETPYTVPVSTNSATSLPPTLDQPKDMTINENAGQQTVTLTGISSGATNVVRLLSVVAISSNPSLIPNPTLSYTSPNSTGTLTFTPAPNSYGTVSMTVMVDNSAPSNNTVIRSFSVTVSPVNARPTLNPISDLTINENASPQTVNLSGITSGSSNEVQTLKVTASSSNPSVVPNPTVNYSSPNTTGSLSFSAVSNAVGSSVITVSVDDGQPTNNSIAQSFTVTVNQSSSGPATLTNAIVAPNTTFRFVIPAPYTNGDRFNYSLGSGAPAGTKVSTAHGVTYLTWTPTTAQALTTNLIQIVINDQSKPALSTNQTVLITVMDFLAVRLGSASVAAGQTALVPIYLSSSSGVTNFTFTVDWPTTGFTSPTLFVSAPGIGSSSLLNQQTNLLINLQTAPGQVLLKSNLVAQINVPTLASQPSAFVNLPVRNISGAKPDGSLYVYTMPSPGQVTVVNSKPLLAPAITTDTTRTLTAFGNVGTTYQLQSSSNPSSVLWSPVMTYTQTNIAQTLTVDPANPFVLYRLQAQ